MRRHEAKPGSVFALAAVPSPVNADYISVEWRSDNPEIARVEGNGIVHTGEHGETLITVRLTDRFGQYKEVSATIVSTDTPDNSGVENIEDQTWNATTDGTLIRVNNTVPGDVYTIINMQGMIVASAVADSAVVEYDVVYPGVYIIKSGQKAVKMICR